MTVDPRQGYVGGDAMENGCTPTPSGGRRVMKWLRPGQMFPGKYMISCFLRLTEKATLRLKKHVAASRGMTNTISLTYTCALILASCCLRHTRVYLQPSFSCQT